MPVAQQQLDDALARAGLEPEEMAGELLGAASAGRLHGQVLAPAATPDGYELASNEMETRAATSICVVEDGVGVAIFLARPIHWPGHGLGSRGGKLWLGKDGEMICQPNAPEVDGVVLQQELGSVIDRDTLNWDPQMAVVKEAG